MKLYVIPISPQLPHSDYEKLLTYIPKTKADKIQAFVHFEDSLRGLISDLTARVILAESLNCPLSDISFSYNHYGKPFLKDHPSWHFNLSHSGKWIAAAFDQHPIGIDVEQIKFIKDDLAQRFFSKQEFIWLNQLPPDEQTKGFYYLWTRKEAYLKAIGTGLSTPLDSFHVLNSQVTTFNPQSDFPKNYYLTSQNLENDYYLSLCCVNPNVPDDLKTLTIEELKEKLQRISRS